MTYDAYSYSFGHRRIAHFLYFIYNNNNSNNYVLITILYKNPISRRIALLKIINKGEEKCACP